MMKLRLYQLGFWVAPRVPKRLMQYLAIVAGYCVWLLARGTRARVRANLAHIPTLAADPARLDRVTRQSFVHLMLNYVDLFAPPDQTDPAFAAQFTIENEQLVRDILKRGKGCIMVTHHAGSFEIARQRMRLVFEGPGMIPVEELEPPELFALVAKQRERCGLQFPPISASETLRDMLSALRHNQVIMIAMDRDVLHTGIEMPFFGAPARMPIGIVALARRTGAPIMWASADREGLNRFHSRLTELPVKIDADTRGEDAVRHALQPIVAHMERVILQHPEQWLAPFAGDIWEESAPLTATHPL
jgi:phosphatidylinositol dimannoside acyltransferase